jgi:GT2 family glycosyltransferase
MGAAGPTADADGHSRPYRPEARHDVTAILVTCDGARWLPRVLARLDRQSRRPDRIIAVDVSSNDASRRLLAETLGPEAILTLPRGTAFGAAVQAAREHAAATVAAQRDEADVDVVRWLWLLHDDGAANPDALSHLLDQATRDPLVAVAGPKIRGWRDRRLLLEVGVTISTSGKRVTGLDRNEHDQGQHDGVRDVLAVSTAGMLVRADVLDEVGGFDPALPAFRDDVDLCWRVHRSGYRVICATDAVVHHAQAAAYGRRSVDAAGRHGARAHLLDRRSALYVLLVNRPAAHLPLLLVGMVLGTLARATGYLLGKLPAYAADEMRALGWVLARPLRILRARRQRARTATVSHREVARFLPRTRSQVRAAVEHLAAAVAGRAPATVRSSAPRTTVVETGPTAEEAEDLDVARSDRLRRELTRPGVLLVTALTLLAVVATRDLIGSGRLVGGALLPASDGAAGLWRTYAESWHPVATGSGEPAPPYLAVLAALAAVLGGSGSAAVDVALLGCVPLAGMSAYAALRALRLEAPVRLWAAATYALLPSATGAVATGRLGTAVGHVLLPLLALTLVRALGIRAPLGGGRAVATAAVLLAVTTAFVPLAYVVAAVLICARVLVAVTTGTARRATALRAAAVLAVPPVVLAPWTFAVVTSPTRLLDEPGVTTPALTEPTATGLGLVLAHPGGPGLAPLGLTVGLLLAALAAVLRTTRRADVTAAWAVTAVGLLAALVVSRGGERWPGFATSVAGLGLVTAGVFAGERAKERLAGFSFGWRQPLAVVVSVVAAVTPLVAAGAWLVRGADDPLERRTAGVLPAFVEASGDQPDRARTLVLSPGADGRIGYALLRGPGPRLGETELRPTAAALQRLSGVVAHASSGRGGDDADALASFGVRFLLLRAPQDAPLVRVLDGVPGLARVGTPDGGVLWEVTGRPSRLRIARPGAPAQWLPSDPVRADVTVPAGPTGRLLVLAESADARWKATLDGRTLPAPPSTGGPRRSSCPTPADRSSSSTGTCCDVPCSGSPAGCSWSSCSSPSRRSGSRTRTTTTMTTRSSRDTPASGHHLPRGGRAARRRGGCRRADARRGRCRRRQRSQSASPSPPPWPSAPTPRR